MRENVRWWSWGLRAGMIAAFCVALYAFVRTSIPSVGCRLRIAESCLAAGIDADGENDAVSAKDYYARACTLGVAMGCNNLGTVYQNASGDDKDPLRAMKLYESACSANEMLGCRNLGNLFLHGTGVARDPKRARELFDQACAGGEASACNDAARSRTGAAEAPARSALFSKACEGGSRAGCVNLARALLAGDGIDKNPERARGLLNEGCTYGDAESCAVLGALYLIGQVVPRDPERARQLLRRGCEGGNAGACEAEKKLDSFPPASAIIER